MVICPSICPECHYCSNSWRISNIGLKFGGWCTVLWSRALFKIAMFHQMTWSSAELSYDKLGLWDIIVPSQIKWTHCGLVNRMMSGSLVSTGAGNGLLCLMVPSHYENQCWLTINEILQGNVYSNTVFKVSITSTSDDHHGISNYQSIESLFSSLLYPLLQRSWKGGILVSPCPSVRLWTEWCPLCIFNNTRRIHFIFAHLIKQLQKVCRMWSLFQKSKIWNFGKFFKFVTLTSSSFDLGFNMIQ